MFIDASAIVAILGREPGHEELEKRLTDVASPLLVSPLAKFEAVFGLARQKAVTAKPSPELVRLAQQAVDLFVEDLAAREITISAEIGRAAVEAAATYGKAVGHKADLNFGDCFAYACARTAAVPLLYKGNDFIHTDIDQG
ncbi:MAG TPA: type II toxin-antitoxin system VapC family toxin [Sphingomonas sp.]|nr:type II toxin-antitoxin system VapC family toxin [Sphingomonas sp.]